MNLYCPHCAQILELTPEAIDSFGEDPHFPCPVCGGQVPLPEIASSPPTADGEMGKSASEVTQEKSHAASGHPVAEIGRGLNRNLLVLGVAVLVLLGGAGIYLALTQKGDVYQAREERIREIIRNKYFTDLIASGKATEKELLKLWDIRPYGVGFVGLSGKIGTWDEAVDLATGLGATVLKLDYANASARIFLLDWLVGFTADLGGETHWLLDHGEPKIVSAPVVNGVTTLDRPRRVLLQWDEASTPNYPTERLTLRP